MSTSILSRIPLLRKLVDERFLEHRRRSTSLAGIVGGCLAICLWYYRYAVDRTWNWDLFAVALTFVGIKMAMMAWYRLTD
jgi:hypothetical protein